VILNQLEIEVEAELTMAVSSRPEEEIDQDPAGWAFDPTDVEREEIGLRSLLGAVTELETDGRASGTVTAPGDQPSE
jgi:hypothetical protein